MALLVCVTALAGCGHGPNEPLQRTELTAARARWRDTQPAAYVFTLTRNCFCPQEIVGPVVIEVSDGVVRSRRYEASGEPVAPQFESFFPAIEGLFAVVEDAMARGAASLEVEYDRAQGYPVRIWIDYHARYVDDELGFVVRDWRDLTVLQ